MQVQFIVTPECESMIDALEKEDEDAAACILVLLEELEQHVDELRPDLFRDALHHTFIAPFDVRGVQAAQKLGCNISRIKLWNEEQGDLLPYRILIGYNARKDIFYALSVQPRVSAYDTRTPEWKNTIDLYNRLCNN